MKSKIKVYSCVVTMFLVLLFTTLTAEAAQEKGDWKYECYGNTAVITQYLGNDREVTVPETIEGYTVIEIAENAFLGNTDLVKIYFPEKLRIIGESAFSGCTSLVEMTLPENLANVGGFAFKNCTALEKVVVNSRELNDFPEYNVVFSNAGYRTIEGMTVIFTDKVTKIPANMFKKYHGEPFVKKIEIGKNVEIIDSSAFEGCEYLEEVHIGTGSILQSVEERAFYGCKNLNSFSFPEKIQLIGEKAFYSCEKLMELMLPQNLKDVGENAFSCCVSLEKVIVDSIKLNLCSYESTFDGAGTKSINGIEVEFTDNATVIPGCLFTPSKYVVNVRKVILGKNITSIGYRAFEGCNVLEEVIIPSESALQSIGEQAFSGCSKLQEINFPKKLSNISSFAFKNCSSLTEIILPEELKTVGMDAFINCERLNKIIVNSIALNSFNSASTFENAGMRAEDGLSVVFTDNVTRIPAYMFYSFSNIVYVKTVEVGRNVKSIGGSAFSGCDYLEKITILNRECSIPGSEYVLGSRSETVIYGYSKSTAETYANKYGYKFVALPEPIVLSVFSDVHIDWYVDYVEYVYKNDLMTGISGTTEFQPNTNITKAQVAQVLYNMEVEHRNTEDRVFAELTDVYEAEWYADAVSWAYNTGIVTGDTNAKKFFPNADVTREQLAIMMYRYAKYKGMNTSVSSDLAGLKNAENVSNWALDGVKWAVGSGLISGIDKNGVKDLAPQGNATRAQMAAILQRFCEK